MSRFSPKSTELPHGSEVTAIGQVQTFGRSATDVLPAGYQLMSDGLFFLLIIG